MSQLIIQRDLRLPWARLTCHRPKRLVLCTCSNRSCVMNSVRWSSLHFSPSLPPQSTTNFSFIESVARKEVVRTSRQRRDNDDDYNSLFLRVIKKKKVVPYSGAIFLLNYTVERVITRVSEESPSDFFTFPNIRTSLSFSFFIGRAALYSAPKLDDGRLSTCTRNEYDRNLGQICGIGSKRKEGRGWKIIEMRVLERVACVGKNAFARKTWFSV